MRQLTASLSDTLGCVGWILPVRLLPFAGDAALLPLVALVRRAAVCLVAFCSLSVPGLWTDEALGEETGIAPQRLDGTHGLLMP